MYSFRNVLTSLTKLFQHQKGVGKPVSPLHYTRRCFSSPITALPNYITSQRNDDPIEFPCTTPILFYDRVFEEPTSKYQTYSTANYDIAKNGVDEHGRLVTYCPELFRPLISNYYDELKNYPFDWLAENNFADPDSRCMRGYCSTRLDIAALLFAWGGCKELEKISLQYVALVLIVDDFLETERTPECAWIREATIDMAVRIFNNSSVSADNIERVSEKFNTIPSTLESRKYNPTDADTTYFGEKRRIEVIVRASEEIVRNCKKIMTTAQIDLFFTTMCTYLRKSVIQMDNVFSIEHEGEIPTPELYFDTRKDSIAVMPMLALSSIINYGKQDELLKSHNDGLSYWSSCLVAIINDIYSYHREKRMDMHFFNLVNILLIRDPELREFDAMAQVVKFYNSQLAAVYQIVQSMDRENYEYYVRCMKFATGTVENNRICARYGWNNISDIHEKHDRLIYQGQEY